MTILDKIDLDLEESLIRLHFKDNKTPLLISFNTPSRRFYLSLIALILIEMKNLGSTGYIYIRKFENTLKELDGLLAGQHASDTPEGMWEKIRKAWRYGLPDLETAEYFSILNREKLPPFEKGGKYRYNCSDEECDIWASLFQYDELNTWRLKFAINSVSLGLHDIRLTMGDLTDHTAWQEFIKQKRTAATGIERVAKEIQTRTGNRKWHGYLISLIILFSLLVVGIAIVKRVNQPVPSPSELEMSDKNSVAVLPFVNVSDDPDLEYFCDGVTDEIISKLAKLKDMRVISRTSAFALKESGLDIRTIAEKLGVDNVLEGSVRAADKELRITAQLVRASDDSHLWSETYDREMKDVFGLQENLAQEIACILKSRLGCNGDDIFGRHSTENLAAYNLYLKGRFYFFKNADQEAIEYFERAIEVSPDYAAAYAGLADAFQLVAFYNSGLRTPYYQKAKSAALKALELDDRLHEAYVSLARYKMHFEWDWKGVEKAILQAIDLNPGAAEPHSFYGHYLRAMGRLDEAIAEGEISLKLDPLSIVANNRYGLSLLVDRQFEAAVKQLEATLKMYPEDLGTLLYLGEAYLLQNRSEDGMALMEKAYLLFKDMSELMYGIFGQSHGNIGNLEKARSILNEALEKRRASYFSPFAIALIYQGLGHIDKTFEWLEKAYEERDPAMIFITGYPQLWGLHADSRFQDLLKKMGLEG
jgi:TolB-like protein